eukprot:XP_001701182.1 predicted protein [Chlamydomonas reinhardtii]
MLGAARGALLPRRHAEVLVDAEAAGRSGGTGGGGGAERAGASGRAAPARFHVGAGGAGTSVPAAHGGGGGCRVCGPRLELAYWRAAAAVLRRTSFGVRAEPTSAAGSREEHKRALMMVEECFYLDVATPEGSPLPRRAPRGLAAALDAGVLAAFESALRTARDPYFGCDLIQAFFHLPLEEHRLGLRWPLFQQLLAFAPPAQTATLITSIGKRLHAALDAGASATAAAAAMAPSVQGGGEVEPPRGMAIDVLLAFVTLTPTKSLAGALGCDASGDDGRGGDGCSGNDDAPAPAPPPAPHPHARRVRLLFSHVLHRWLPALSRALRRPETLNKAFVMAIIMPHTMCWLQQALLSLLRLEAKAAPCASASASASASVSTRADTTSGHGASGDSTSGDIISAAASATAAATAAASAAAATAAATVTATARAVAATAAAASWRQLLLHDIELVPLLETGLRLLAVTRLGYPLADDSAFLVCGVLSALTLAAPDALAPVLLRDAGSPPAPGLAPNDSPWHPDWLRAVVLRHRPADAALHRLLRDLESLRRDAAVAAAGAAAAGLGGGGGGAALHSTFLGRFDRLTTLYMRV